MNYIFWNKYPNVEKERMVKDDLENNIFPLINSLTEEYFGKKFISNMLGEIYLFWDETYISGRTEILKGEGEKWKMFIGTPENFNDNSISGKGIEVILHEYSHLYLFDKFSKEEYDNLDKDLLEGFCDFSSLAIIKKTSDRRLDEAREFVEYWENLFIRDLGIKWSPSWEMRVKNKTKYRVIEYPFEDKRRLAHQLFYHNLFSKKPLEILQDKIGFNEFVKHHKYHAFVPNSRGKKLFQKFNHIHFNNYL